MLMSAKLYAFVLYERIFLRNFTELHSGYRNVWNILGSNEEI